MKFKKYIKESVTPAKTHKLVLDEFMGDPDEPLVHVQDEIDAFYAPVKKLIQAGEIEAAREELDRLEADFNEFEQENSRKKFFRFPQFMINRERRRIDELRASLQTNESVDDMNKRCEKCNTLLNDAGTCPKCDDGEEDYGDEIKEELSNKEKLKRAYPELSFDNDTLTEGTGAQTTTLIKDAMNTLAKDDRNKWAVKVGEIVSAIPDNYADDLFDAIKSSFSNIRLTSSDKQKFADAAEDAISEDSVKDSDTLGDILNAIDITQWSKKNPQFIKTLLLIVVGIVAVIEPTPVVEVIMSVIVLLPGTVISKIASILSVVSNPVAAGVAVVNKARQKNEELSVRERLKAAYPELNFDTPVEEGLISTIADKVGSALGLTNESTEEPDDSEQEYDAYADYDDDYDFDDVEQDRAHAALYGGDRMYCDCGQKLSMDEWGSYCPRCNPKDPEEVYDESYYDDLDDDHLES